ncbi:hypothetical protein RJ639_037535 [Escallonia herrerae]|uniref:ATP-grasp domain-containing protein n=1 Tax=Escallonia herrerae TaxID=1293975 RepID=A0AA88WMH0_9ASTE|nr:hypothetical protein RJ639_037535 [Escallonia herrerae]
MFARFMCHLQVAYHTPPRFPMDVIDSIRKGASLLFQRFGLRDFARIDGWFLPSSACTFSSLENKFGRTESGAVLFTDINLISGMEQTSFLFQQASKVGFSHSNILRTIIQRACLRFPGLASFTSVSSPKRRRSISQHAEPFTKHQGVPKKAFVIFGGDTSERQVSLMSGTNVWLNLQASDDLEVTPCLLAPSSDCSSNISSDNKETDVSLKTAHGVIEMPNPPPEMLIFEPFIETDEIIISSKSTNETAHRLLWEGRSRWVEITVGVIGTRGSMRSLTPSITVKESGDILSLEEKFQGGTGINLTPPPSPIISNEALLRCKQRIELIANTLQLEGFSRIDAFVNADSGEVLIIEVNTVPGMTPSTVLIHQALEEQPPMYPHRFFRTLLDLASDRSI